MTEVKFTGEEDEHLIELVAKNPPLFDAQVESYKDGNIRDHIWRNIAEKLNKSDGDCKKRWKYIRDSFNRFKRKRKMSTGSTVPPKNSKWEFYDRLQFLGLVSTQRNGGSNVDSESAVAPSSPAIEHIAIKPEPVHGEECLNDGAQSPISPPSPAQRNKGRGDDFLDYSRGRDKATAELEDDVTSYGNHLKSVLRKLHPRLRIQAKSEIFTVLSKYEMIQLDMQQDPGGMSSDICDAQMFS